MRKKMITLIRHAESENNNLHDILGEDYHLQRKADPEITSKGRMQAELLNSYFKANAAEYNFDLILSSPMLRALQTSEIAMHDLPGQRRVSSIIFEAKGPYKLDTPWPGLPRSTIMNTYKDFFVPHTITEQGWYLSDKKESPVDVYTRVSKVLRLLYTENFTRLAIISHAKFLSYLFSVIMRKFILKGTNIDMKFFPSNTSLTNIILTENKEFIIKDFCVIPHLSPKIANNLM